MTLRKCANPLCEVLVTPTKAERRSNVIQFPTWAMPVKQWKRAA